MKKLLLLLPLLFLSACEAPQSIPTTATPVVSVAVSPSPIACTMDAKVCPDGSAVGRVAPKCEFAECPLTATSPTASPLPSEEISPSPVSVLPKGSLSLQSDGWYSGIMYAKGYIIKEKRQQNFCETKNCKEFEYVLFVPEEYSPKSALDDLKKGELPDTIRTKGFPIGCLEEANISYVYPNFIYGRYGHEKRISFTKGSFSEQEAQKILNSTPQNLLTLKLTKEGFAAETELSDCYTPFSSFEIL